MISIFANLQSKDENSYFIVIINCRQHEKLPAVYHIYSKKVKLASILSYSRIDIQ